MAHGEEDVSATYLISAPEHAARAHAAWARSRSPSGSTNLIAAPYPGQPARV